MTQTDLANVALGHLGSAKIMAITEISPAAEHCRRMWDLTRDSLLRQRHWNFALRRTTLSRLANAPLFGWAAAFQLPVDCLLVVELNGRRGGTGEAAFETEGTQILCDDEAAVLRYVRRVENVTEWDASFCVAFAYLLAAAVAPSLTTAQGLADRLLERGQQFMLQAFGPDNLETRPQTVLAQTDSGWLNARLGAENWNQGGITRAFAPEPLPESLVGLNDDEEEEGEG